MNAPFDADPATLASRVVTGLSKIGLALRTEAWQAAGARGLTPTQGQILALVRARGALRLGALAKALGVTLPTASDAVRALVEKGLAKKSRAKDDARAVSIGLTAVGRREAERAAAWPDFLAGAVEALSPEERVAFLRGLLKMIRALQEAGKIPVQRMCVTCRFFRPNAHPEDAERPHHCAFVDAPFGDASLRIDCPDHEPEPTTGGRS